MCSDTLTTYLDLILWFAGEKKERMNDRLTMEGMQGV